MEKRFCEVCKEETKFQRLKIPVKTEVRGTSLQVDYESDECTVCHTSYEPLENTNKNILSKYAAYREKVGYLQPEEIRSIREKYKLNVRQFADILGINYQSLARIELGALQNAYENKLFECATSPKVMYKWVKRENGELVVPVRNMEKHLPHLK